MKNKDDVKNKLQKVYELNNNILLGLAGSYVKNTQTSGSDIDIVIDAPISLIEDYEFNLSLHEKISYVLKTDNYDLIWLPLLKSDDENLDKRAESWGLPPNLESPYKNIIKEVEWVGK